MSPAAVIRESAGPAAGGPPELFRPLRYTPEQASRFGEFDYPAIVRLAPGSQPSRRARS